jgi:hypothetical protein
VGLKSLKSLNLINFYPNNKKKNKIIKSKPLELYELAGKKSIFDPLKCFHCFFPLANEVVGHDGTDIYDTTTDISTTVDNAKGSTVIPDGQDTGQEDNTTEDLPKKSSGNASRFKGGGALVTKNNNTSNNNNNNNAGMAITPNAVTILNSLLCMLFCYIGV